VLTNLSADHVYGVKEGQGVVAYEKIRPVLAKN